MVKKKTKSKKSTSKKLAEKATRRNPREGERFRQKREQDLYASRGPEIPDWLAEDNSVEAEKIKDKMRKYWKQEVYWNLRGDD